MQPPLWLIQVQDLESRPWVVVSLDESDRRVDSSEPAPRPTTLVQEEAIRESEKPPEPEGPSDFSTGKLPLEVLPVKSDGPTKV